jgi:hypothetical protein
VRVPFRRLPVDQDRLTPAEFIPPRQQPPRRPRSLLAADQVSAKIAELLGPCETPTSAVSIAAE